MAALQQRIARVFQEVFDNDDLEVTDSLSPGNTKAWDSLAQVRLIIGLEEEFHVKFTTGETAAIASVAGFRAALEAKGVR